MLPLLIQNMLKQFSGKKTDTKDSVWITDIFKHGLVEGSFMPPLTIRQLRDLMRYRFKLVNCKSSEKNRFQNSLTVSNIMISNIVTDTFGKTSKSILELILSKEDNVSMEEISPLLRKNLKSSPQEILDSVEGNLTHEQNSKMKVCLKHYDNILDCINQIEQAILPLIQPFQNEINLILTVPGVKDISAITILSEIGADMSVFKDAEHLCSWAGLTPQCNESAGKKKSVHVSRAGIYLKPLLIQCANNAIRDKNCPYFKLRYDAIKKRRGHKRAIIAIARMLLTCIYHMLSKNVFLDKIYKDIDLSNAIIVSPDIGGVGRSRFIAKALNLDIAIIDKRRDRANECEIMNIVGDVKGKDAIIIDDIIDTGGTLIKGINALKQAGMNKIYVFVTHAVCSGDAYERINSSPVDKLYITDSLQVMKDRLGSKIEVLSVDQVIADAIKCIHMEQSISVLFNN